jgi:putative membrane protein
MTDDAAGRLQGLRRPHLHYAARAIALPLALLLAWDVGITVANREGVPGFGGIALQYSLFGSAVALFVGFMVNAAYARWWEARTLFGAVINESRSLARQAVTLLDDPAVAGQMITAQIAYVHVLRTALRREEFPEQAVRHLSADVRTEVAAASNPPSVILRHIGQLAAGAVRAGRLSDYARVRVETTLVSSTSAQGGLERIANTPLPIQYRALPTLFSRAFCLVLPFSVVGDLGWFTPLGSGLIGVMFLLSVQVGVDLADPFGVDASDLPLSQLSRVAEADLLDTLGSLSKVSAGQAEPY